MSNTPNAPAQFVLIKTTFVKSKSKTWALRDFFVQTSLDLPA
jgi:hypothetical protein